MLDAAKAQTAMTHNTPEVAASARFLAGLCVNVLKGGTPAEAVDHAVKEGSLGPVQAYVEKGLKSAGADTRNAITGFGQMCGVSAALPSVVHLILKYENDLASGLIENVMAGGDSAARGMAVGMVLGANCGQEGIPSNWLSELAGYQTIERALDTIG
jgi:ADP-ribosylglycohydrolase